MNLSEIVDFLNLKIFSAKENLGREVKGVYVSDLLSDVLGNAKDSQIWITLQSHKNIVALACLKGLACVVLVKGILPNEDTILKAEEEGIVILGTEKETFDIAGELYELLKRKV